MHWDDDDFNSPDPFVRYNAHQAAKGRSGLDVDAVSEQIEDPARRQRFYMKIARAMRGQGAHTARRAAVRCAWDARAERVRPERTNRYGQPEP